MGLFLIGLLLSIPLAVGANLLTPWVRTKYAARNSVRKNHRIKGITKELARVEKYRLGSPNELVAYAAYRILGMLGDTMFAVIFALAFFVTDTNGNTRDAGTQIFEVFLGVITVVTVVIATMHGTNVSRFFKNIYNNAAYRERLDKQLRKLGTSIVQLSPDPEIGKAAAIERS